MKTKKFLYFGKFHNQEKTRRQSADVLSSMDIHHLVIEYIGDQQDTAEADVLPTALNVGNRYDIQHKNAWIQNRNKRQRSNKTGICIPNIQLHVDRKFQRQRRHYILHKRDPQHCN